MKDKLRRGMLSFDWAYIGSALGEEDSDAQTKFFKAFLHECKSWGTHQQIEMQLACINRDLTDEEIETLKMLSYKDGDK